MLNWTCSNATAKADVRLRRKLGPCRTKLVAAAVALLRLFRPFACTLSSPHVNHMQQSETMGYGNEEAQVPVDRDDCQEGHPGSSTVALLRNLSQGQVRRTAILVHTL